MSFQEAVRSVFEHYADFSGRARRSEYWYWSLALFIGYVVLAILAAIARPFLFLLVIGYLAVLVPSLAVLWRRLHDTGRSGWWWLIGLVPLVGGIVLIVFCVQDSQPGDNQYGGNPKAVGGPPPGAAATYGA